MLITISAGLARILSVRKRDGNVKRSESARQSYWKALHYNLFVRFD